jgi:tetratricopeptide (TPR) repeat protein
MHRRTGAAISFAALVVASCGGGAPPAESPNAGCTGAWAGTQCVHEVTVGDVAATASSPATAPPPPLAPAQPRPPSASSPASSPAVARARDPRASRLRARALALLVTEIQQLETLASATPDSQPDKAQLLRRLAEDYVELETAATNAGRAPIVASAGKAAIKYYDALVLGFASYPSLDEVRYFDAIERERMGDLAGARRLYFDVIAHHPTSKYVAYAYFAFGEMFAAEGASDPSKLDLALQAYQKTVAYPPPANAIYGWAWLRIGIVQDQKGNAPEARDAYAKAKDFATSYAQLPGSAELLAAIPP